MAKSTEMLKGVLEGVVLELISHEETYGYEITKQLNELGFEDIVEGTVYTILIRLEKEELVTVSKRPSDKGPVRKFYSINLRGQTELNSFWKRWNFLNKIMKEIKE